MRQALKWFSLVVVVGLAGIAGLIVVCLVTISILAASVEEQSGPVAQHDAPAIEASETSAGNNPPAPNPTPALVVPVETPATAI